jgi:cation diffusion facilitator CzcD-associated flavoprotein CzcO
MTQHPASVSPPHDRVLVIGAGPAGLSAGVALRARGIPFDLVDEAERVGGIWDIERARTPMYESAHFISSRTLSGFRDFPMPESDPDYPSHDQVLRYVRDYARAHDLERHLISGTRVESVRRERGGGWRVETSPGEPRVYAAVVVATGAAWYPRMPDYPGDFTGESYHAFHYRSPEELRDKRVLVVGGGNSGCDIACDAALTARRAFLSLRRGYRFVPKYVFGRPTDVFARRGPHLPSWLEERVFDVLLDRVLVGDLRRYGLPRPDHPVLASHPIMNTRILHHLGHGELEAVPDVHELRGRRVVFQGGREEELDVVVFATGYERAFPFLDEADLDRTPATGAGPGPLDLYLNVFHRRHATLAFLGLFETDGAAYGLLGLQAELVAGHLAEHRRGSDAAAAFAERRRSARPDLRGGRRYLSTPRHEYYVRGDVYERVLRRVGRETGWIR